MSNNPPLTSSEVPVPTTTIEDRPSVANGFPGNQQDDDPLALDQYFEAADAGPLEYQGVVPVTSELTPPDGLLLTGGSILLPGGTPGTDSLHAVQLLNSDPKRKHIYFNAFASGAFGYIALSNEAFSVVGDALTAVAPGVINSGNRAMFLCLQNANTQFLVDDFTGPLWACAVGPVALSIALAYSVVTG